MEIINPTTTKDIEGRLQRGVILTIDTIMELLKDHVPEEDLPSDSEPLKLFLHPKQKKIGIVVRSKEWKDLPGTELQEIPVTFKLKRVYGVKGGGDNG